MATPKQGHTLTYDAASLDLQSPLAKPWFRQVTKKCKDLSHCPAIVESTGSEPRPWQYNPADCSRPFSSALLHMARGPAHGASLFSYQKCFVENFIRTYK